MHTDKNNAPVLNTEEARQSVRVGLIWVLTISSIGAAVALALLYGVFYAG